MTHGNLLLCSEHHRLTGEILATQARELRRAGLRAQARHTDALAATHAHWASELADLAALTRALVAQLHADSAHQISTK